MNLMFIIPVVIALLIIAVIITVMSRYKRCKSDEVLVVYGKTSGNTSAKCYHGGAAFVWPVIQGYQIMSMKPMQIQCNLSSVWSKQKVKVSVPTVVTVATSTKPEVMLNAAVRLLNMTDKERIDTIKDIVFGQMRLVIAQMEVEELVSNRDKFLESCITNIGNELNKLGLDLININIADVTDEAQYLENQGKQAEERARNEANRQIEEQIKLGEIGVAEQKKEKEIELSRIQRDKEIQVATNTKEQAVKTAEITKDKETITAETAKEQAVRLAEIEKDKSIEIATNESVQAQKVAEQNRLRDVEIANQEASRDAEKAEKYAKSRTEQAQYNQTANAEIAKAEAESATKQAEAKQEAAARIAEATSASEAQQVKARQEAEAAKTKATQEKEANEAQYQSESRIKKANANKAAVVNENNNKVEIAKSDAVLGKERANADQTIGEAQALAEEAVGKAQARKDEEVAKAKAKAKTEELNATIIVDAKAEAERKKVEAEGIKIKAVTEAEGQAKAIEEIAKAEATKVEMMKTAEARGEQQMAEARRLYTAAETENIVNMKKAGVEDAAVISYILRDEYKLIAEADAKKFEHIQTGNVTVVGGSDAAGNFMLNTAKKIQELSAIRGLIPGLGGLLGKAEEFDAKHQLTSGQEPTGDPDPNQPTPPVNNGKSKKSKKDNPEFEEVK